jgi:hypothetical protein
VRRTELVAAASLVVLGLAAIFAVIPYAVVEAPASSKLTPKFMPYVAAALVTLAALGWLVAELRAARAAAGVAAEPRAAEPPAAVAVAVAERSAARFVAAAAAVLGGSFALMSTAGYLVGAAALVAGTLAIARARLATIVVTAVAAPLVLWALFVYVLATPLP